MISFYILLCTKNQRDCLILNAIIQKKEKKSRSFFNRWRGSNRPFTDDELKVFAVSRSLAGALKALIDVPMLDDGKISQAAEAKYQAVGACLPAYTQDIKAVSTVHRSLRKSARKEQELLLAPVVESLIGMVKPTGFFAKGWANKVLVRCAASRLCLERGAVVSVAVRPVSCHVRLGISGSKIFLLVSRQVRCLGVSCDVLGRLDFHGAWCFLGLVS